MFRWLAGAAVLATLAVSSGAAAETQGRPFTRLDPERWAWAYRSVERLETAGYFTGSPAGTFNGARSLTRYEFAAAVERVYRSLLSRAQAASEPGSLPQELFAINQLIGEFTSEIADLGHDVQEMRRQLRLSSERLDRLTPGGPAVPEVDGAGRLSNGSLRLGSGFGLRRAINQPNAETQPPLVKAPTGPLFLPGLTANLGFGSLDLRVADRDPLDTVPGMRLEDPAAGLRYRAQLSMPVGQYLLKAFYNRDNGRSDRFGFWDPIFSRPYQGVGGALSGSLSSRLDFELEAARLRAEMDRLFYVKGGLNYDLGKGLGVGFDIWRSFGSGLQGTDLRGTAYIFSVQRSLGRNAQFNFLYRYFLADPGVGFGAGGSNRESGALGQFTVRF